MPIAIDLFCGLGGWTEGLLAEGWHVIGIDIEEHVYGEHRYPADLVLHDVLKLHGAWFKDADLIVASPPCQEFSYMAMPWSRAKQIGRALRGEDVFPETYKGSRTCAELTALFDACFRIQREACEAAGRHIPMVVENVKGAQPWVGRARWSFGSFYLWGDVPALMPPVVKAVKVGGLDWKHPSDPRHRPGQAFNPAAQGAALREERATKNAGGSWFNVAHNTTSGTGQNPDGRKTSGAPHIRDGEISTRRLTNPAEHRHRDPMAATSGVNRKFASAMIAKIPLPLSRFIGTHYYPMWAHAQSPAATASPSRSPAPATPAGDPQSAGANDFHPPSPAC